MLGQDLPQLPFGEAVILGGGDEGDEVAIRAAEHPAMGLPVHGAGEPLHGGEGDVQGQAAPPVRPHAASSTPEDAVGWAVSPAAFSAAWASARRR